MPHDERCCFCAEYTLWNYGQKVQPRFRRTVAYFATRVWEISNTFLQNEAGLGRRRRRREIVVRRTARPVLAGDSRSSSDVAVGFSAASPTGFLLVPTPDRTICGAIRRGPHAGDALAICEIRSGWASIEMRRPDRLPAEEDRAL